MGVNQNKTNILINCFNYKNYTFSIYLFKLLQKIYLLKFFLKSLLFIYEKTKSEKVSIVSSVRKRIFLIVYH